MSNLSSRGLVNLSTGNLSYWSCNHEVRSNDRKKMLKGFKFQNPRISSTSGNQLPGSRLLIWERLGI